MESIANMKLPDCSICSQPFILNGYLSNKTVRIPLLLHCAHPACENCIISNLRVKNFITCLICKKVSSVLSSSEESDVLSQFPIDNTLCGMCFNKSNSVSIQSDTQIGFIKPVMKKKDSSKTMLCNECQDDRADQQCKQCNAPYCSSCFKKVHSAARALRDHASTPLNENDNDVKEDFESTNCKEHSSHEIEFFCDQCDVTICSHCLLASHNGHKIRILLEKNQEFRSDLIDSYVRISNIQRRLKASKKEVKQLLTTNRKKDRDKDKDKDSAPVEIKVRDYFLTLHGVIALLENKIMNQIKGAQSSSSLNDIMSQLTSYIEETDNVLYNTKNFLKEDAMAHANYRNLLTLLKSKEKIPCFILKDSIDDSIIFNTDPKIFEAIDNCCSITIKQKSEYKLICESELPDSFVPERIDEISATDVEAALAMLKEEQKKDEPVSGKKLNQSSKESVRAGSDSSNVSVVSVSSSVNDIPYSLNGDELVPGCTVHVTISHLLSPSDFYVHRLTVLKKITELQNLLRRCGLGKMNHRLISSSIIKGGIFMIYFESDSCWYRVRIMEVINDKEVKVHYIDYGNSEVISKDKLKSLPQNIRCVPPLALRCRLANCQPINGEAWDPQAITIMAQITNSYTNPVLLTVIEKTHLFYEVEMVKNAESYSFNVADTLIFLNLAVTSNIPKAYLDTTIPARNLRTMPSRPVIKQGSILDASIAHIVDPGHFYIIVKQNGPRSGRRLLEMQDDLQRTYNIRNPNSHIMYNPKPGNYVAAKCSDKQWYRAEVLTIPDSKMVKVFYIDLGSTEVLNWTNIKILIAKFYKLPPQAHCCRLADIDPLGSEDWNEKASALLRKETAGALLKAMVDTVNDDAISVVLYKTGNDSDICINALLVRKQLAISTGVNSTVVEFPKLYDISVSENTYQCDIAVERQMKTLMTKPSLSQIDASFNKYFIKAANGCLKIQVNIKRIVDPGEFYITLCYVEEEIKQMEKELQEYYNNNVIPVELTQWKVDTRCATRIGNKWFRAIIEEILEENRYKVYIPDEGIVEVVEGSSLRQLTEKFVSQRDGVSKCHLGGLLPSLDNWSKTSFTEFEEFSRSNAGNLYITKMSQSEMKGSSLPVELFKRSIIPAGPLEAAKDNWTSFNHYLRMIGLAKADSVTKWDVDGSIIADNKAEENKTETEAKILQEILSSSFKSFSKPKSPESNLCDIGEVAVKWLPPEPIVTLEFIGTPTYIDDDCNIYIQDFMKSTLSLPQICDHLTNRFEKTLPTPYDLRWTPGDICAAQYFVDKRWYRGLVKKVLSDEITLVQFVDYGNVDPCPVGSLRKKPIMTHIPIQATSFKLHTIAPANSENQWKREDLDNIHRSVSTKNCRVELEIIGDGFGVKRLIMADGKDAISLWVTNGWARCANEPLAAYLMRQKKEIKAEKEEKEQEEERDEDEDEEEEEGQLMEDEREEEDNEALDGDYDANSEQDDDDNDDDDDDDDDDDTPVPDSTVDPVEVVVDVDGTETDDEVGQKEEEIVAEPKKILHWSYIVSNDDKAKSRCRYQQLELGDDIDTLSVEVGAVLSGTEMVLNIFNTDNIELMESREEFSKVLEIMQKEASAQPLLEEPYKYKMCCAQFTADKTWYRAFVLDVLSYGTLLIQYIDYGNVEVLAPDQVHTIAEEWLKPKAQSILCSLQDIQVNETLTKKEIMNKVSACLSAGVLEAKIITRSLVNVVELFIEDQLAYQPLIDEGVFIKTSK